MNGPWSRARPLDSGLGSLADVGGRWCGIGTVLRVARTHGRDVAQLGGIDGHALRRVEPRGAAATGHVERQFCGDRQFGPDLFAVAQVFYGPVVGEMSQDPEAPAAGEP